MCTIYMTSESETKIRSLYCNLKYFFVLDVQAFVKSLDLDMTSPCSIFLANDEIQKLIISQTRLKKFKGVVYINKYLDESIYYSFKTFFKKTEPVKIALIDNGQFPKHEDIMHIFDEVIFYERFKKNKIVECSGFETSGDDKVNNILMDENEFENE